MHKDSMVIALSQKEMHRKVTLVVLGNMVRIAAKAVLGLAR